MSGVITAERGGRDDGPLMVLLHGLGHTAQVWRELIDLLSQRWPGGWLAPDLPGHGRSPWLDAYSFDGMAAEVATVLPAGRPVVAVGHSMGGVVALALAAVTPEVDGVLGFGIKVAWTEDELAAMAARAARPPRTFDSQDEACAAFVRFAGLDGVMSPDSQFGRSGVVGVDGGFRLATDPRTMAVGAPDMPAMLAAARADARVLLARGASDHMVSAEQLGAVDRDAVTVPGAGHNLHVTHPELLLGLLDDLAAPAR
jgi:pimeloyl-ACP methyl ester carboxylesterase